MQTFLPQSVNWGMTGHACWISPKDDKQAHHWDTPPMDVTAIRAGLLACGSWLLSRLPGEKHQWHAATETRRSQLRGQRRSCHSISEHRTGFPLSLRAVSTRKTLTPANWLGRRPESRTAVVMHRLQRDVWNLSGPRALGRLPAVCAGSPCMTDRRFTKTANEGPCCASRPC